MLGPAAEHLGHLLVWTVLRRITIAAMLAMPFYQPIIEGGVRIALRDLLYNLEDFTVDVDPCLQCGSGD